MSVAECAPSELCGSELMARPLGCLHKLMRALSRSRLGKSACQRREQEQGRASLLALLL